MGTGEDIGGGSAQIAIEGKVASVGGGARRGHGDGEDGVRSETAFVGRAIELDEAARRACAGRRHRIR